MAEFVEVATMSELSSGKMLVEIDDRLVVLAKVGDHIYCIDDVCTHDGGPLSEGPVEDNSIACPRHGAKFDLCTGQALSMPATEATKAHDVKVEGERILIRINED